MKKNRIWIIMFLVLFTITVHEQSVQAQNKIRSTINFKRITIEDGLSQTSVEYIYQDSYGYMYFATNDGLNKYDGSNFEIYRGDENSLSASYISCLIEDGNKNLWVGTSNGLNRVNTNTGEIKKYLSDGEEGRLSHYGICEIFIDSKGIMWVSTLDGINIYDDKNDSFKRILYDSNKEILTSQTIYSVVEDSDGVFWIGTDNGLNSFNEKTGEVKWYVHDENNESSISTNEVYDLFIDDEDCLWISTIGGGLNKLDIKTGKFKSYKNNPDDTSSIPGNDVRAVLKDRKGRVWVGTNSGLARFDEESEKFTTYKSKIYDNTSLINDRIYNLFEDESGMIWIGTIDGVSVFYPESIFTTYRQNPFDVNSISSNMINGIYEDDDGLMWLGTGQEGISVLDRENNKYYNYSNKDSGESIFTSDKISTISGKGNDIWIGTESGLNKVNKKTGEIKKYFYTEESAFNKNIRDIYISNDETVWIGTREGLFSIDKNDNIKNYNDIFNESNIEELMISCIFEDSEGYMWIGFGVEDGLVRYDIKTGDIKQYKNNINDRNSLSFNAVKDIAEDKLGNLWVSTNRGLNKFNKKNETFTRYLETDGLSNSYVYSVLIDNENNPWVSTNYGISKYDIEEEKFINFNVNDGLQGNEFNFNASFISNSGEMFFGGINGFNSFYPEDFNVDPYVTSVVISEVSVNGNKLNPFSNVVLEHYDNNIKVGYFLPDYRNSKKIEYAYMLEGVDNSWNFAENINKVTYNNLDSGEYILKLVARSAYGDWSEPIEYRFKKKTAPWRSKWAILAYIVTTILIFFTIWNRVKILDGLIKQRTSELDRKLKKNEALYKKIIENEKNKNNYFINLSHELRTPLNVILSTEQLISVLNSKEEHINKEKLSHYMDVLNSNSKRLLKLINDIIDTTKIESGSYKLDINEYDIVYHIEELALSMKDFIESKGIELIIDPEVEEKVIECDIYDVEKCIINILGNATKFTPAGGKIEVVMRDLGNKVQIQITDTGIGIDKKDLEAIFDRFGQAYNKKSEEFGGSGIGLTLTKQLVQLHNGELIVESEIGKGSSFIIILPVKQG